MNAFERERKHARRWAQHTGQTENKTTTKKTKTKTRNNERDEIEWIRRSSSSRSCLKQTETELYTVIRWAVIERQRQSQTHSVSGAVRTLVDCSICKSWRVCVSVCILYILLSIRCIYKHTNLYKYTLLVCVCSAIDRSSRIIKQQQQQQQLYYTRTHAHTDTYWQTRAQTVIQPSWKEVSMVAHTFGREF